MNGEVVGEAATSRPVPSPRSPRSSPRMPEDFGNSRPVAEPAPQEPAQPVPEPQDEPPGEPGVPHKPAPSDPPPAGPPTGLRGTFPALARVAPSKSYLQFFEDSGRPRFGSGNAFQERLRKKFGAALNRPQPATEKSRRIYQELLAAVNREVSTERSYLLIPAQEARQWSRAIEMNGGRSPKRGAYSIAVDQTAVRHGFANVPCAEFVSEVVREAYARADVDVVEDFNSRRRNTLIWSSTAAVVELGRALLKAGWVPWVARDYRPPIGAILLNGVGETPGHAFLAAGRDGRFIVDNGAPQGRDLGSGTSAATIGMMFSAGVFFLPAGINPERWP